MKEIIESKEAAFFLNGDSLPHFWTGDQENSCSMHLEFFPGSFT
jgi:hypothetical protein